MPVRALPCLAGGDADPKKLMGIAAMAIIAGGAGAAFAPATADTTVGPIEGKYVNVGEDHTGVYEESNGCAGLQTHAGNCDGVEGDEEADTKVA